MDEANRSAWSSDSFVYLKCEGKSDEKGIESDYCYIEHVYNKRISNMLVVKTSQVLVCSHDSVKKMTCPINQEEICAGGLS